MKTIKVKGTRRHNFALFANYNLMFSHKRQKFASSAPDEVDFLANITIYSI
jgi:hypothetical protein